MEDLFEDLAAESMGQDGLTGIGRHGKPGLLELIRGLIGFRTQRLSDICRKTPFWPHEPAHSSHWLQRALGGAMVGVERDR